MMIRLVGELQPADSPYFDTGIAEPHYAVVRARVRVRAGAKVRNLVAAVAFLSAVIAIQIHAGAYRGERGTYSDESAHFMNGLLLRDYLYEGGSRSPLAFAKEYYLHYPKIGPGMWPPLFHIALGVFLLPGWPAQGAAIFFLAVIAAWTAWRLYRVVTPLAGTATAVLLGGLFLLTPAVVDLTSSVMLDLLIAALALEATCWLALFFSSEHWRHGALFGLFTALCCLTKGNGVALVMTPIVLVVLTHRYALLRRSGLYVAAAIVIAFAVPPLLVSYRLDAAIGDFGPVTAAVALERIRFYSSHIYGQLGTVPLVLALIGFIGSMRRRRSEPALPPWPEALAAVASTGFLFHVFNPHMGADGRYITLVLAPILGLTATGVSTVMNLCRVPRWRATCEAVVLTVVAATFLAARPALVVRKPLGYRALVSMLESGRAMAGQTILVVSDENGEGALVAEVATRREYRAPTVIRGTKFLTSDDWSGHNFQMTFQSPALLMRALEDIHLDYVLLDSSPGAVRQPYWEQARKLIASNGDRLGLAYANVVDPENGPTRSLTLYRLRYRSPGPPVKFGVDLKYSLGEVLSY
jgi:hypothetical protein